MAKLLYSIILGALYAVTCLVYADEAQPISQQTIAQTIGELRGTLERNYIHQDKVDTIHSALQDRHLEGAYDSASIASEFADRLTHDLIEASDDFHFAVAYDPQWIETARREPSDHASLQEDALESLERSNFGFQKLEILEGNVGYIRFDYFPDPQHSFEAGARAMRFVENADAIIFDMRYNRGGHNQFAQYITSFLYEASDHRMIHEYAYMQDGELVSGEYWTIPTLPGKRMPEIPVFVLTSTTTFSAGEWFAYELQKLGRATLVGQTTTGASHAVNRVPINDHFLLQVPVGIGRDPVDKSDFEGIGVKPDVRIDASLAKIEAHKLALSAIAKNAPERRADLKWLRPLLEARRVTPKLSEAQLERLAGRYNGRQIKRSDDRLTYHWRERFQLTLVPLTETLFAVEGSNDFRFRFAEENGAVVALERLDRDGGATSYERQ